MLATLSAICAPTLTASPHFIPPSASPKIEGERYPTIEMPWIGPEKAEKNIAENCNPAVAISLPDSPDWVSPA